MSIVDRSIVTILPHNPDIETPSRKHGISAIVERQHRLCGTSLIAAACTLLKLNISTYATTCTIFHRMFHRVSLTQYCIWNVVSASLLLATKCTEHGQEHRTIHTIIVIIDHLYRKRRGCYKNKEMKSESNNQHGVLSLSTLGPAYTEWYNNTISMEHEILRQLGFTFYWISDSYPHLYLREFLKLILDIKDEEENFLISSKKGINKTTTRKEDDQDEEKDDGKEGEEMKNNESANNANNNIDNKHRELAQLAWNYCNDSYRLDLCVRFESEVIVSTNNVTHFD